MASGVGFAGVENFASTYPGTALGVVANAHNGYGDSLGNANSIVYGGLAPVTNFIAMEGTGYILREDSGKILLDD